jgi:hypothetical protein
MSDKTAASMENWSRFLICSPRSSSHGEEIFITQVRSGTAGLSEMAFLFSVRTISSLFSLSSLFSSQIIFHFKGNIWGLYQAPWLVMTSEGAATATICTFIKVFIGGAFCLVVAVLPARRRLPCSETGCIIPHRRVSPDHERAGATNSRKKRLSATTCFKTHCCDCALVAER